MAPHPARVLSICAGIGGLDRGLRMALPTARTVCYIEREAFAAEILATRMGEGNLDSAPVWSDLTTFDGKPWRGRVEGIMGGFPCQPFSQAGRLRGINDERWLWDHILRIIDDVEPVWVFFENVPGLRKQGLRRIVGDLAARGFVGEWDCYSAQQVGAPHIRERLFVLAHRDDAGFRQRGLVADRDEGGEGVSRNPTQPTRPEVAGMADAPSKHEREPNHEARTEPWERAREDVGGRSCIVADTNNGHGSKHGLSAGQDALGSEGETMGDTNEPGLEGRRASAAEREREREGADEWPPWPPGPTDSDAWGRVLERHPELAPALEPPVRGVANEFAPWLDRLRALGNGVVPVQAAYAFNELRTRLLGSLK